MDPVRIGLIQCVEDEFGISVSAEEAREARTAGDLHLLLTKKLTRGDALLLSRALYRARRALADALQIPRHSITPQTRLAELVPSQERAQRWSEIARYAGGRFPPLCHSRELQDRILLLSMAAASVPVIALWWALYALGWLRGIWALLFFMPAAFAFLLVESRIDKHLLGVTRRWATELPCQTVEELAGELAQLNPSRTGNVLEKPPSHEDVWAKLAALIRQSTGGDHLSILPGTEIPQPEKMEQS